MTPCETAFRLLREIREAPADHMNCVKFDTEGGDNLDVYEVDDRCALCREIDRLLEQEAQ